MIDKNTSTDQLRRYNAMVKADPPKLIGTPEQRRIKKEVRDRLDDMANSDDDPLKK